MTIIDPILAEKEFYSKKLYLSYSALSKMLYAPKLYYEWYVLKQQEDTLGAVATEGKVIHNLLLEDGTFDDKFLVTPGDLPSGKTLEVLNKVYDYAVNNNLEDLNLKSLEHVIIETLKSVNLHQSLKTDVQRIEKVITDQSTAYYNFLMTKGTKTILDAETLAKCKEYESVMRNNNEVSKLFALDTWARPEGLIVVNEQMFKTDIDNSIFGLKGVPDNVVINPVEQTVSINDLKTTVKTVADFHESVEYYRYDIQAAIQHLLIWAKYPEYRHFKWTFTFTVIDKYQQVYPFRVSDATLVKWMDNLNEVLGVAEYHYKNKRWGLPMKYDRGEVIL